ncbi:MAG: MipA/OmpV family protein [Erythrobacter sp.]
MKHFTRCISAVTAAMLGVVAAPALASGEAAGDDAAQSTTDNDLAPLLVSVASYDLARAAQDGAVQDDSGVRSGGPPAGMQSVFDDNWINIGLGMGLVPTYAGSNDYFLFPVPLITGRLGGVGFRPAGAGMVFDVLSPQPTVLQNNKKAQVSLGPTFRFRVDRAVNPRDEVVDAAGRLDNAFEVGIAGGLTFPAVLNPNDSLTVSTAVRWDVAGAHRGQVIEPTVAYLTPLSLGILVQWSATVEIVDDNFANYYFTVNPAQSAASGLPLFNGSGGVNRIGTNLTAAFDLDGNALNGGFNIFTVAGYSRLLGDGANNPFTAVRGSPNQFLFGLGVGYTF